MTVIAKIPVELNEYSVSVQILHTINPIVICKKIDIIIRIGRET